MGTLPQKGGVFDQKWQVFRHPQHPPLHVPACLQVLCKSFTIPFNAYFPLLQSKNMKQHTGILCVNMRLQWIQVTHPKCPLSV